jgi:putative transcriptional regulator
MTQVLRNKNLATKFQILLEIAANQPNIQQKDIAGKIGVTSQAVSDYISKLEKDGWLTSDGRSRYRITKEGVNWMLKSLRELQQYSTSAEKVLTNINTWAVIAALDVIKGQKVGLTMQDGLLCASAFYGKGASGIATDNAAKGEDVGITDIEGIVQLDIGQITILEVPDIRRGGSKYVNLSKMKNALAKDSLIGVIGIEAFAALGKIDIKPGYIYGVTQAAIEATRSGLSFVIVCNSSESPALLQRLNDENIKYNLVDIRNKR